MNAMFLFREAFSVILMVLQGSSFCVYLVDESVDVLKAHITQPVMSSPAREVETAVELRLSSLQKYIISKFHKKIEYCRFISHEVLKLNTVKNLILQSPKWKCWLVFSSLILLFSLMSDLIWIWFDLFERGFSYLLPDLIPPGACNLLNSSSIYANNEVSLAEVDIYGFDYDYTLALYSNALNTMIYNAARGFLIEHFKVCFLCLHY